MKSLQSIYTRWLRPIAMIACVVIVCTPDVANALSTAQRNLMKSGVYYFDIATGDCADGSSFATGSTTLVGKDNAQKAYNFFVGKGLSPQQAAGVVGNFIAEGGLNPSSQQGGGSQKTPIPGQGFGIAQWTPASRQQGLIDLAKKENVPVNSLAVQLEYVWQELNGGFKQVLANVKKQSSVEDATLYFMGNASAGGSISGYENPGSLRLAARVQAAKKVLSLYGGGASSGGSSSTSTANGESAAQCGDTGGDDGLGIINGFAFPEKTTQAAIKNVKGTVPWCYKSQTNCHHDYNAADIFNAVGTTNVAATPGKVMYVKDVGACDGWRGVPHLQIKGDNGLYYYYTHMKPGSIVVHGGQHVKAGDPIGQIGPTNCAQGTAPHLHFQMSHVEIANTSSASERKQYINPQPNLVAAFAKLPEN